MILKTRMSWKFYSCFFFLTGNFFSNAQDDGVIKVNYNYIIFFNPIYQSNSINFSSSNFYESYVLSSAKSVNIDSLICGLCKKNHTSLKGILDSFSQSFNIYKIGKDSLENKRALSSRYKDLNYYKIGYLFMLNGAIRSRNPIIGYVVKRFTSTERIDFEILSKNCYNKYPYDCRVL